MCRLYVVLLSDLAYILQMLAGDMSEANREACAEATRPLINSVESLTAYALSPEFAPLRAKISEEVTEFIASNTAFL